MRANEFLVEWEMTDFDQFMSNCAEYISHMRNPHNYLLRGDYKSVQSDNFIVNSRNVVEGRKPVDTDEVIHDMVNNEFLTKFNIPFRSGMMCSGSISQAQDYGRVSVVIPCNGYTACYSPVYADMYSNMINDDMREAAGEINDDGYDKATQRQATSKLRVLVRMAFQRGKYTMGPDIIDAAIMSGNEVMLYPTDYSTLNYYAFSENFYNTVVVPLINQRLGK